MGGQLVNDAYIHSLTLKDQASGDISVPLAFAVVSWLLAFALAFVSADGGGWSMVSDEYIHI